MHRHRLVAALRWVVGAVGVAVFVVLLRHTDWDAVRAFGVYAVAAVLLEGTRPAAEALATRRLHGAAVRVPWGPLLRAHAAGYALAMTMPAGRGVAEAAKAVMLAPWATTGRSVGVALTNQSLVFFAAGTLALAGAAGAALLRASLLATAATLQGVALVASGAGLLAMVRSRTIAAWVARRYPRAGAYAKGAAEGVDGAGVPWAYGCFLWHRSVQAAQLALLLTALGRFDAARALALTAAVVLGASAGIAVPGQLGATGAALALAAPAVGITAPQGLAMALVLHVAQGCWSALGLGVWAARRDAKATG